MPPVTRAHLDGLLSALVGSPIASAGPVSNRPHADWDVFPRVGVSDFEPRLAGDASSQIWWSRWADDAFDAAGALVRPMLLRWRGSRNRLQLAAARQGLAARLVSTERYNRGGLLILAPEALEQQTDLGRLLVGFAALRADGCVALELAGLTQSDGWSDVAEAQEHNQQTAIFWHDQTQDGLDGLGMISGEICLYWRGSRETIARHLRGAGLTVDTPADQHTAFTVRSVHPPPSLPTAADAERWEQPLPPSAAAMPTDGPLQIAAHSTHLGETDHEIGYPVTGLWPSPDGKTLLLKTDTALRGSAEIHLESLDPLTFRAVPGPDIPQHAWLGTACWLSETRALIAWLDYRAKDNQRLVLTDWSDGQTAEVLRLVDTHPGQRDVLAVDADGSVVMLPRPTGAQLRSLGAPGTAARTRDPNVRVRRKNPRPQKARPWDILHRVRCLSQDAYGHVALSPDGQTLAVTADGLHTVYVDDRDGARLWTADPFEAHYGSRGTRQLGFTPDGALLFVRTVRNRRTAGGHTSAHRTLLMQARTGRRTLPALEDALDGATAVAFLAAPLRCVAGMEDGRLLVLDQHGKTLAETQPLAHGSITAVAVGPGRIYVGGSRGALCTLRYRSASSAARSASASSSPRP